MNYLITLTALLFSLMTFTTGCDNRTAVEGSAVDSETSMVAGELASELNGQALKKFVDESDGKFAEYEEAGSATEETDEVYEASAQSDPMKQLPFESMCSGTEVYFDGECRKQGFFWPLREFDLVGYFGGKSGTGDVVYLVEQPSELTLQLVALSSNQINSGAPNRGGYEITSHVNQEMSYSTSGKSISVYTELREPIAGTLTVVEWSRHTAYSDGSSGYCDQDGCVEYQSDGEASDCTKQIAAATARLAFECTKCIVETTPFMGLSGAAIIMGLVQLTPAGWGLTLTTGVVLTAGFASGAAWYTAGQDLCEKLTDSFDASEIADKCDDATTTGGGGGGDGGSGGISGVPGGTDMPIDVFVPLGGADHCGVMEDKIVAVMFIDDNGAEQCIRATTTSCWEIEEDGESACRCYYMPTGEDCTGEEDAYTPN